MPKRDNHHGAPRDLTDLQALRDGTPRGRSEVAAYLDAITKRLGHWLVDPRHTGEITAACAAIQQHRKEVIASGVLS